MGGSAEGGGAQQRHVKQSLWTAPWKCAETVDAQVVTQASFRTLPPLPSS